MKDEISEIYVLILDIFEKNDNDAIVKTISKNQFFYFLVKGYTKPESKNRPNLTIGSLVEVEYFNNYGFQNQYLLKKATLIKSINLNQEKNAHFLNKLFFLFKTIEEPNENLFNSYEKFIDLNNYNFDLYFLTYFLNLILATKGKKIISSCCAICYSKKDLYCIDLDNGGMLCYQHKVSNCINELEVVKSFYYLSENLETYFQKTNIKANNIIYKILFNLL